MATERTVQRALRILETLKSQPGVAFDLVTGQDQQMLAEWGPACPDYDAECPCCRAWRFYRRNGFMPDGQRGA